MPSSIDDSSRVHPEYLCASFHVFVVRYLAKMPHHYESLHPNVQNKRRAEQTLDLLDMHHRKDFTSLSKLLQL